MWLFSGKASGFEFPHTKKCGYRTAAPCLFHSFTLYTPSPCSEFSHTTLNYAGAEQWEPTPMGKQEQSNAERCELGTAWKVAIRNRQLAQIWQLSVLYWQRPVPNSLSQKQFSNATLGITRLYNSVQAQPQTARSLRCLCDLRYQRLEPYRVNFFKSFIDESFMLYM